MLTIINDDNDDNDGNDENDDNDDNDEFICRATRAPVCGVIG